MLRAGLVTEVATASPGVSRRQRIVYQITPGRHGVLRRARSPTSARRPGRTRTSTCGSRSSPAPTPRCACASWRAAAPGSRSGSTAPAPAAARGDDRYVSELQRHAIESVEREVRWLTDLIAAERPGPSPCRRQPTHRPRPATPAPGTTTSHATQRRAADPDRRRRDQSQPTTSTVERKENPMGSVRVAIVGVGNCASSLVQGVEYYKDADPAGNVPGLMHVTFGDYHVADVEFVAAFDVDAKKVGFDLSDAINRLGEQHHPDLRRPADRRDRPARPHPRRPRQVLPRDHRGVRRRAGRRRPGAQGHRGRRAGLLPPGGLGEGRQVLRPVRDRRRRGLRQRAAGLHRLRPRVGQEVRGRRRPDRR